MKISKTKAVMLIILLALIIAPYVIRYNRNYYIRIDHEKNIAYKFDKKTSILMSVDTLRYEKEQKKQEFDNTGIYLFYGSIIFEKEIFDK